MIEKNRHIREMYDLKHMHDSSDEPLLDYGKDLLKRTTSPAMWTNPATAGFLHVLQGMLICMIESALEVRNAFNYAVDKYYNGHVE